MHLDPVNPGRQVQEKEFIPSLQEPPFRQGFGAQSLMSVSQSAPVYPALQAQL